MLIRNKNTFLLFITIFQLVYITKGSPVTSTTEESIDTELCPCPTNITTSSESNLNHAVEKSNNYFRAMFHGTPCMCHIGHQPAIRDDYKYSGIGAHKLHTRAATWNDARKMCNEEGAHLAIINNYAEAQILKDLFNRSGPIKGASYQDVAYLGIHDLYKEGEWVTILGDSLYKTGYTNWSDKWGGQPDNGSGKQNCGVMLKDGSLDDVYCDIPFAFFCELPPIRYL